ncbi:MAG: DUF3792 family protein [Ruminococcaceae bacterium]|nr:DUF3792 family protein [Oscillospiraceae bacterium]
MKKTDFGKNNVLLKYILKVIFSAIISLLLLSYVFSKLAYALDLDTKYNIYLTIIISVITAAITSFISVIGIKNNGALLGAFAQIPLILYSLLNVIFNENEFIFFCIKSVLVILTGLVIGYLTSEKSKKLRIK